MQIPGTNAVQNQVPLSSEDVTLRFTITNDAGIEYTEEHLVTTDENGMVSLIVGEGTPIDYTFDDIIWDGKDDFNEVLARGVYIYKLTVTNEEGFRADKTQTMFLLK